jgi:hypothetical protein
MQPQRQNTPPEEEPTVSSVAALEFPRLTATEEKILHELGRSPGMTPAELADKIGKTDAREAIWRLLAVGEIQLGSDLRLVLPATHHER